VYISAILIQVTNGGQIVQNKRRYKINALSIYNIEVKLTYFYMPCLLFINKKRIWKINDAGIDKLTLDTGRINKVTFIAGAREKNICFSYKFDQYNRFIGYFVLQNTNFKTNFT
jgi:hypothetical protein